MKKQILDWLFLDASHGSGTLPNYQHKEFVLTITRLLRDKNVDLVYIINYYLSHLHLWINTPQHNSDIYKNLFVKTIQHYGKEWDIDWDIDYVDSDEWDFEAING